MKKLILPFFLTLVISAISLMALMPGTTSLGECNKFHPHTDEFGGPAEALKILGYMATNMPINVWTDGVRTVIQATYQTKQIFVVYGTGNPTMFTSSRGIDYIREQTAGLNKVTSESGIKSARDSINSCLRASFESSLSTATSSTSVAAFSNDDLTSLLPSLAWAISGSMIVIVGFMLGKKALCH